MRRIAGIIALVFVGAVLVWRISPMLPRANKSADKPKSEVPSPETDLPKADLPKADLPKIDLPKAETPTSTGTVLFEDHFADNSHKWEIMHEPTRHQIVQNGKYRMDNFEKKQVYWAFQNIPLENDDNFMIEASFTQIEGQKESSYGLIWGCDDKDRFYTFAISDEGYYEIQRSTDTWEDLVSYSPSSSIVKHNGTNLLRIEKKGFQLMFYINNTLVTTQTHQALFGKGIGFFLNTSVKMDVDDFVVKKL
jgi:hypothetical protein